MFVQWIKMILKESSMKVDLYLDANGALLQIMFAWWVWNICLYKKIFMFAQWIYFWKEPHETASSLSC